MIIICVLIIASILIITLFLNWYANYQTNKEVARQGGDRVEECKIDRYEKHNSKQLACEFIEEFTQQINRSIMVENQILITELNSIKKLLNDLYEGIDEYYTETLERNDELAIACADAQLQLIKKIIDKMEEI